MLSQTILQLESPALDGRLSFFWLTHCLLFPWMAVLIPVVPIFDGLVYVWLLISLVQSIAESQGHNRHLKPVLRRIKQAS